MHQNTFLPLQIMKNIFFLKHVSNGLVVSANASKRIFNLSRRKKYGFKKHVSNVLEVFANASKRIF
jgi:hypothetical protein